MTWLRKALKSPLGRDHYKTLTTAAIARELTPAAGWRVTASAAALGVIAGVVTVTVAVAGVILGATVDLKDGVVEVKRRGQSESTTIALGDAVAHVRSLVGA